MRFAKMHGLGNDYVYVDGFSQALPGSAELPALARRVSDRHRGIGSDGLILIRPAADADCEMEMYNADGSKSEMCGNGIRCVAKYVYDRGIARRRDLRVKTGAGVLSLRIVEETGGLATRVRVDMGIPRLLRSEIPMGGPPGERAVGVPLWALDREFQMTAVSVGNPHCVIFLEGESVANFPVDRYGPAIETMALFPNRVNVHFVEPLAGGPLRQRTWERGAGETQACGTGATATGVAAVLNGLASGAITVRLLGGDLEIEWRGDGPVFKTGPAEHVFDGEWRDR